MATLQSKRYIILMLQFFGIVGIIFFCVITNRRDSVGARDLYLIQNPIILQNDDPIILKNNSLARIQNCWFYLFNKLFVKETLHHIFSKEHVDNTRDYTDCNADKMHILLNKTSNSLSQLSIHNFNYNYHDLIALRRIIMLFHQNNLNVSTTFNVAKYENILALIAKMESKYIVTHRNNYTIFNIHPPRSAGTFICGWFKKAKNKQKTLSLQQQKYQRKIDPFPPGKRNCNAGDGKQFTHYGDTAAKTCNEQYNMHNNTMIARESPLYPNRNEYNIKHPLLCNKFVYVFAFRSPIERIFSWDKADHSFAIRTANNRSWTKLGKSWTDFAKLLPNFYFSLFDFKVNKPANNVIDIIGKDNETQKTQIKILSRNQFIRPYSSNAVTKWIGYEWEEEDIGDISGKNIVKSLLTPTEKINNNDIHFYNAIKLLLKIDYVLNFASYENDSSAVYANKYAKEPFGNIISGFTKMSDADSMWDVFGKHMKSHFNISQDVNIFTFDKHRNSRAQHTDNMTGNDWKTLYKQNYFDFRLYSLSKMIEKVDVMYYNGIYKSF